MIEEHTSIFIRTRFAEYYRRERIKAPPRVEQREFGIGTTKGKICLRHKSFKSEAELNAFLRVEAPLYISCSVAYYEHPASKPMEAKGWLGADLVFDLDAETETLQRAVLEEVREEVLQLLDLLRGDLGLKGIEVNFSGNKGYHVHVRDEDVLSMDSDARREVLDYVLGSGLKLKYFLRKSAREGVGRRVALEGPKRGDPGWAGRIYEAVSSFLKEPREGLLSSSQLKRLKAEREKLLCTLDKGLWGGLIALGLGRSVSQLILERFPAKALRRADRLVTIDTSRLMRLPDSIHGSTGLVAKCVRDIETFDPTHDALAFGDDEVKVRVLKTVPAFELGGEAFGSFKAGELLRLPEYAAIYLMLGGYADLIYT